MGWWYQADLDQFIRTPGYQDVGYQDSSLSDGLMTCQVS